MKFAEVAGARSMGEEAGPRSINSLVGVRRPIRTSTSIVIPTLGRPILERSLCRIANASQWPAQLIVVDQGNRPEVDGWLRRLEALGLPCRYVPSSKRGRAVGVNRGLELVTSRFVAVTDDDCFVGDRWLERMADRLESEPESIVTGRVECETGSGVISVVRSEHEIVHRRRSLRFPGASGGNLGVALEVIDRIGAFDEDPRICTAEDCEWSYRALRAGVPISYAPEVCVIHHGWRDESQRSRQYRSYARSHGGFYGKYLRRGDWFIALGVVIHHARALRRWVRGLRIGDVDLARNGRAYFTQLLPGIMTGLRSAEKLP